MTVSLAQAALARWQAGRLDEAVALLEAAAAQEASLHDSFASLLHERGNARLGAGDLVAAAEDFRRAVGFSSSDARSAFNLGVIEERLGRPAEAEAAYRIAIARDPELKEAWNNLLLLEKASGRTDDALRAGRMAQVADPTFYQAVVNFGDLSAALGRIEEAVRHFRRASALQSEAWEAQVGRGLAHGMAGDVEAALAALRRAIALNPAARMAWNNLSVAAPSAGEVIVALERAHAIAPDDAVVHSNLIFALTYVADAGDPRPQIEARRWGARHAPPIPIPSFANPRDPDRRLRIAYLSSDFRSHPIAHNWLALVSGHDRAQVEVMAYSATTTPDGVSRTLAQAVDVWRDVAGRSHAEIADLMRADGVDILAVVAGHAGANPLKVAGFRPAPVQLSMYDVTTSGVAAMDAWVTDPVLHPAATVERFVEQLVYLPCYCVHLPPGDVPAPLRQGGGPPVFGSFNNPIKLSQALLGAWRRILDAVPGSSLVLKYKNRFGSPLIQAPIRAALGDRVRFASGDRGRSDHLALWNEVDIALDSYPFNGSTTTFEALLMGVPVVTLAGARFVSRISASFLTHVGLSDLVARDLDGYVERAVTLAGDRARLAELRSGLRARVAASALCDAEAHARALAGVYRGLWRAWCARP